MTTLHLRLSRCLLRLSKRLSKRLHRRRKRLHRSLHRRRRRTRAHSRTCRTCRMRVQLADGATCSEQAASMLLRRSVHTTRICMLTTMRSRRNSQQSLTSRNSRLQSNPA